jgi:hypothetical protein
MTSAINNSRNRGAVGYGGLLLSSAISTTTSDPMAADALFSRQD